VLPVLRSTRLVIFDRYLLDLLVDPVRYRLPARAMHFAAAIVRLAPEPDLCVLLDAPAEQVQQRKQEVSLAESQWQRAAYLNLFRSLPRTLVVNADSPVEEVARNVTTAIIQTSSQRFRRESGLSDCRLPI
jgi:thymidylate kinase